MNIMFLNNSKSTFINLVIITTYFTRSSKIKTYYLQFITHNRNLSIHHHHSAKFILNMINVTLHSFQSFSFFDSPSTCIFKNIPNKSKEKNECKIPTGSKQFVFIFTIFSSTMVKS